MKPRIVKKLCKRVYEIAGGRFGKPWVDVDPLGEFRYGYVYRKDREKSAKKFRRYCNYKSSVSHCLMAGGGPDYWGEAEDPVFLYDAALGQMLWEFGERTFEEIKGPDGNVIDNVPGWPRYHKRLTGKEVIRLLKISEGLL